MLNTDKFKSAEYEQRVQEVLVPGLASFFPEGEKAVVKVRGQTSSEIARTEEIDQQHQDIVTMLQAITTTKGQINAIKQHLGMDESVPTSIKKRMRKIVECCVEPVVDMPFVILLAERHPLEFGLISNAIAEATNKGMSLKKSLPSGEIQK